MKINKAVRMQCSLALVLMFNASAFSKVIDKQSGVAFTEQMGAFKFYNKRSYNHPSLGYSLNYISDGTKHRGSKASIILYDFGMKNIQQGLKDKRLQQQFDKAYTDVKTVMARGYYKAVNIIRKTPINTKHYLVLSMKITLPNGLIYRSHLMMRAQNGKFIKVRITGPDNDYTDKITNDLVKRISSVFGLK